MSDLVNAYQETIFKFPSHDVNPIDKKEIQWCMDFSKAIYSEYVRDYGGIPYSRVDYLRLLRQYGAGSQPPDIYQDWLEGEGPADGGEGEEANKGFYNINWEILSVLPKFRSIVVGIVQSSEHRVSAEATNPLAMGEKERIKWGIWFDRSYKKDLEKGDAMMGIEPNQTQYEPETIGELEMFSQMGGVKLAEEVALELATDYCFTDNEWKDIERKLVGDVFDLNMAGTRDYTDPTTQVVKARYLDPVRTVIQYSRTWNFKDSEYAGEIIPMTITELRRLGGFTEDELQGAAKAYNGLFGNETISRWDEGGDDDSGNYAYDSFRIYVLDAEWFSNDLKYVTKRENRYGDEFSYTEKYGKVYDKEKKKTEIDTIKTVYRCKWLIGTELAWDNGLQFDIPREKRRYPKLSFNLVKLPGKSKIELCQQSADQVQLAFLKMQNELAIASPSGLAVEWDSLEGMIPKMKPLEILKLRRAGGDLIYKATTHTGGLNSPTGVRPIMELQGGVGKALQEYIQVIEWNLEKIRDVTGINRIADASTPDPKQSVSGTKMAMQSSVNALKELIQGVFFIKEYTAQNMALRVMDVVQSAMGFEYYADAIGSEFAEILKTMGGDPDNAMMIKLEVLPTGEDREQVRMMAMEAMRAGKDGVPQIDAGDYLMVEKLMDQGSIKYAVAFLVAKRRKNDIKAQQTQDRNMQLNQQMQLQAIEAKKIADMQFTKFETDEAIRLEKAKAMFKIDVNAALEKDKLISGVAQESAKAGLMPDQAMAGEQGAESQGTPVQQ